MKNKSIKILAIDQSLTCSGIAFLVDGELVDSGVIKSKHKGIERLKDIVNEFDGWMEVYRPDYVVMEGYSFMSKGRATFSLGELGGVLKCSISDVVGNRFLVIPPASWKKVMFDNGAMKKDQVLKEIFKRFNVDLDKNDKADAYCLAKYLDIYLHWKKDNKSVLKYQDKVFKKFELSFKE